MNKLYSSEIKQTNNINSNYSYTTLPAGINGYQNQNFNEGRARISRNNTLNYSQRKPTKLDSRFHMISRNRKAKKRIYSEKTCKCIRKFGISLFPYVKDKGPTQIS